MSSSVASSPGKVAITFGTATLGGGFPAYGWTRSPTHQHEPARCPEGAHVFSLSIFVSFEHLRRKSPIPAATHAFPVRFHTKHLLRSTNDGS